jgi:hypothetical protein
MGTDSADFPTPLSDQRGSGPYELPDSEALLDDFKPSINFDHLDNVLDSPLKAQVNDMKAKIQLKRKNKSISKADLHIQK